MKIKIVLFLTLSFLLSCKSDKQTKIEKKQNHVFTISGNSKQFSSQKFFLQSDSNSNIILTAEKIKGNFYFRSQNKLDVGKYFIKIENEPKRIPLLIDNTDVKVFINHLNLDDSYIEGNSPFQKKYNNFVKGSKISKNLFAYQKRFIEENKNTILAAIVLKDMLGNTQWRLKQTLKLYEQLDKKIKNKNIGKEINTFITIGLDKIVDTELENKIDPEQIANSDVSPTKKPKKKEINQEKKHKTKRDITAYAPYFYGNALEGGELSAKAIFNKNKVTLIDFWASWCRPCRAQNPELVSLYNKYHSKGFEILSIAEDKDDTNWKNAINQDNMTWKHVNDDHKRIATMYGVRSIPHAILVDNQGGIIAKKVSPNRLRQLLEEEFGK